MWDDAGGVGSDRLTGRWVILRPATPADLPLLYQLAIEPETGYRSRYFGATPGYEEFSHHAWNDVVGMWVVESRHDRAFRGVTLITSADYRSGTAYFSVFMDPRSRLRAIGMDALATTISYAFWAFPFRILFADVAESNFDQFASGVDRYFRVEGRRRHAIWVAGSFNDLVLIAIERDEWRVAGGATHERLKRRIQLEEYEGGD